MQRVYGVALLLPAVSLAPACSSPTTTHTTHAPATLEPTLEPVLAHRLFTPGPSLHTAAVFDDKTNEPLGQQRTTATAPDQTGAWQTETVLEAQPPKHAGYLRLEDGSVALAWSRSVKDTDPDGPARLYVFDPPLVMVPPLLTPGEVFESSSRMTERHPRDEDRVVLTGTARRRLWIASAADEGLTPSGDPHAVAAVGVLRIEVGPAVALRRTAQRLTGDRQPGEEIVEYTITVLGLRFKHERTRLVPQRQPAPQHEPNPNTAH